MEEPKRIRIEAHLLHRCQREKNLGGVDALAFCLRARFMHRKNIIYKTSDYKTSDLGKEFNIGPARLQRIIDNCIRLNLIRVTKKGDYELLPIRGKGHGCCNVMVELPHNVREMKINDISYILSLFDLRNQIMIIQSGDQGCALAKGPSGKSDRTYKAARLHNKKARVSYQTLAEKMNVSERTIIRYMKVAVALGIIKKYFNIDSEPIKDFIDLEKVREQQGDGFVFIKGKNICVQHANSYQAMPLASGKNSVSFHGSDKKPASISKKMSRFYGKLSSKKECHRIINLQKRVEGSRVCSNTHTRVSLVERDIELYGYITESTLYKGMGALSL